MFTFVAHHTVNLVYESLDARYKSLKSFRIVSSASTMMAVVISLALGLFVYMTFWQNASSSIFELYPSGSRAIDRCRLLLCISMLLTYPFPFFTVRELIVISIVDHYRSKMNWSTSKNDDDDDEFEALQNDYSSLTPTGEGNNCQQQRTIMSNLSWLLLPGDAMNSQLILKYHVAMTITLFFTTLILAIVARSLGDVLNLTGCATGTGTCWENGMSR